MVRTVGALIASAFLIGQHGAGMASTYKGRYFANDMPCQTSSTGTASSPSNVASRDRSGYYSERSSRAAGARMFVSTEARRFKLFARRWLLCAFEDEVLQETHQI